MVGLIGQTRASLRKGCVGGTNHDGGKEGGREGKGQSK